MAATVISGKDISKKIKEELRVEVEKMKNDHGFTPGLAVILVGENPASVVYVRNKEKACAAVGIYSEKHDLPASTSQEELLALIDKLNNDPKINGILVQLPVPDQIDEKAVLEAISPNKDVDGFHPYNVGRLMTGDATFISCTPYGVIKMLEYSNIDIKGKHAVIVGRSNIVGKPVALLLMELHATITICHSRSVPLADYTKQADILIAAIGRPEMITADMVKDGAVVIDVGINRRDDGKLVGDVAYDEVLQKASAISPVPGGVGPMTIAMLLYNTVQSAKKEKGIA